MQVASLALFTGQPDVARRTLEGSRDRIAQAVRAGRPSAARAGAHALVGLQHLQPDRLLQPREARCRAWASISGSTRRPTAAACARRFDYLVPFAAGDRPWPHPQLTTFRSSELHWLLRHAASAWKEPLYQQLAGRVGGGSPRLALMMR